MNSETMIQCDSCGHEMAVEQALARRVAGRLEQRLRSELEGAAREREKALIAQTAKETTARLERQAAQSAEHAALELADLREQLAAQQAAAEEARKAELELRKRERALRDRAQNMDLELERRIEKEREALQTEAREQWAAEHDLKNREKEKQMEDLRREIAALKRKSEVTNNEHQGTSMEAALEERLQRAFPTDRIERIKKGRRGADILVRVMVGSQEAGSILIESKNAEHWNDGWLTKLKEDRLREEAGVAVLISRAMPAGVTTFAELDGVWVGAFSMADALVAALRMGLLREHWARQQIAHRGTNMEALYDYVGGDQFRSRVVAMAEAFLTMKSDIDAERRSFERSWAKRTRQIEGVMMNMAGMYGDLQGLMGASLPEVEVLDLPA